MLAAEFVERRYRRPQHALPDRVTTVERHLRRYIVPFFVARCATPAAVHVDGCEDFMLFLAGRCAADGTSVVGTDVELPALTTDYQDDIKRVLQDLLTFACDRRLIDHNPAAVIRAARPLGRRKTARGERVLLSWADTRDVARGLHPIHQTVLWIQRVVGLRVAEVYGLHVGDIGRDGAERPGRCRVHLRDVPRGLSTAVMIAFLQTLATSDGNLVGEA